MARLSKQIVLIALAVMPTLIVRAQDLSNSFGQLHSDYKAVKYLVTMDFSRVNDLLPEYSYSSSVTSYAYFLQCGADSVIRIEVPGDELPYMPVMIYTLDNSRKQLTYKMLFNTSNRYYIRSDTLIAQLSLRSASLEKEDLCSTSISSKSICDSVRITMLNDSVSYLIKSDTTETNVRSPKLFYPQVEFLPIRIQRLANSRITQWDLVEVIDGKEAVDSIIQKYDSCWTCELIAEDEAKDYRLDLPQELLDEIKEKDKKRSAIIDSIGN